MTDTITLRLDKDLLRRIETWRRQNPLINSVPDAVSVLVRQGLDAQTEPPLRAFEKFALVMLAQLSRKAGIDDTIDPDFLQSAVQRGHFWALEWQYPNLTETHSNSSSQADFVTRLLSLWRNLADSLDQLPAADRAKVLAETGLSGDFRFPGFDHSRETNYSSIARFMVEQLKLFPSLRDSAALDSRQPMLPAYRALVAAYDRQRESTPEGALDADQLIAVLEAVSPAGARRVTS